MWNWIKKNWKTLASWVLMRAVEKSQKDDPPPPLRPAT